MRLPPQHNFREPAIHSPNSSTPHPDRNFRVPWPCDGTLRLHPIVPIPQNSPHAKSTQNLGHQLRCSIVESVLLRDHALPNACTSDQDTNRVANLADQRSSIEVLNIQLQLLASAQESAIHCRAVCEPSHPLGSI